MAAVVYYKSDAHFCVHCFNGHNVYVHGIASNINTYKEEDSVPIHIDMNHDNAKI